LASVVPVEEQPSKNFVPVEFLIHPRRCSNGDRRVDYLPWIFWIFPASSKSVFVGPPTL